MTTYYKQSVTTPVTTSTRKSDILVYLENPDNNDITSLANIYSLDIDMLRDILDIDEMPRLEVEDGVLYIFTRFAYKNSSGEITTSPLVMCVTKKAVICICQTTFVSLRKYITNDLENPTTKRPKILLEILEQAIMSYQTQLNSVNRQIRSARSSLKGERITNKHFIQFVEIEDVLNELLGDLVPTNAVLFGLISRRQTVTFYEEDKEDLEDFQLHINQIIDTTKGSLKTIINIREAYNNINTNNLNRQIKLLTTITVVLTIPMIIGSLYGMNVPLPGQNNPWMFGGIVAFTSAIGLILLYVFRKIRWF